MAPRERGGIPVASDHVTVCCYVGSKRYEHDRCSTPSARSRMRAGVVGASLGVEAPVRTLAALAAVCAVAACGGTVEPATVGSEARVSHAGPDGDPRWTVSAPAVATGGAADRFLVVWAQGAADAPSRVWARAVGSSGAPEGRATPVSTPGTDADGPAVAWSPARRAFLVVWSARDSEGHRAIRGRQVTGRGRALGPARLITGPDAFTPAVAAAGDGWVVAWRGTIGGEREILARRLTRSARPTGPPLRVSHAGRGGDPSAGASFPAVAAGRRGVLVAWRADGFPGADDELEVYARLLGGPQRRMSAAGPDGDARYAVGPPAVAADGRGFVVAWSGDTATLGEREIHVRRLAPDGTPVAAAEQVTETGPPGDPEAAALGARVACGAPGCLLAWWGDPELPPLEPDEAEVFARVLSPERGDTRRLSAAGPDGEYLFAALDPAVAAGPTGWLVAWKADEPGPPLADNEFEVYARAVRR